MEASTTIAPPPIGWTKTGKDFFSTTPVAAGPATKTHVAGVSVLTAPPAAAGSDPFGRLSVSPEKLEADYEESLKEWEESDAWPTTMRISEAEIVRMRFSQASIAQETKREVSLKDLQVSIQRGWKGPALPVVRYEDGSMTSLGNRRLCACQAIIRQPGRTKELSVRADIYKADDRAPAEVVDRERNNYFNSVVRRVKNARRDYFDIVENEYDRTIARHGIKKGSYAEWVYIRTRSDRDYRPADAEAVRGYDLTPFYRGSF